MKFLLISNTHMVKQIFSLVCNKLEIPFDIIANKEVKDNYDIILVDENFIDDDFNKIKLKAKKIGAISSKDLGVDKNRDFILPRPFLPLQLSQTLKEQIELLNKTEDNLKISSSNKQSKIEEVKDELDSLASTIVESLDLDESDEVDSIITIDDNDISSTPKVLNFDEINKIQDILRKPSLEDITKKDVNQNVVNNYNDISKIIDDAIIEANETLTEEDSNNLTIVINDYTMKELKPLFKKLGQNVIDNLISGQKVNITLEFNR